MATAGLFKKTFAIVSPMVVNFMIGTFFAYGSINAYLAAAFSVRPESTIVILQLWLTTETFGCILQAILADYLNLWFIQYGAMLAYALLFFLTSFIPDVQAFIWVFGLVTGICTGLAILPGVYISWTYFPRRKSLATGLCICSMGLGTAVITPLAALYANPDDLPPSHPRFGERFRSLQRGLGIIFGVLTLVFCSLQPFPLTKEQMKEAEEAEVVKASIEQKTGAGAEKGNNTRHSLPIIEYPNYRRNKRMKSNLQIPARDSPVTALEVNYPCPSLAVGFKSREFYLFVLFIFSANFFIDFVICNWKEYFIYRLPLVSDHSLSQLLIFGGVTNAVVRAFIGPLIEMLGYKGFYWLLSALTIGGSFSIYYLGVTYVTAVIYTTLGFGLMGMLYTGSPCLADSIFGDIIGPKIYSYVYMFLCVSSFGEYFIYVEYGVFGNYQQMYIIFGAFAIVSFIAVVFLDYKPNWRERLGADKYDQIIAELEKKKQAKQLKRNEQSSAPAIESIDTARHPMAVEDRQSELGASRQHPKVKKSSMKKPNRKVDA